MADGRPFHDVVAEFLEQLDDEEREEGGEWLAALHEKRGYRRETHWLEPDPSGGSTESRPRPKPAKSGGGKDDDKSGRRGFYGSR